MEKIEKLSLSQLGRLSADAALKQEKSPIVAVLDNVRSGQNVGSFFRTADAFNIEKLILGGITAVPPHKEVEKTALGATLSVPWEYYETLIPTIKAYKSEGYVICAVEQTSGSVALDTYIPIPKGKYVLIFGNEVEGVNNDLIALCDLILEINQYGSKHSLNVSVCGGIVLWYFSKKLSEN